MEENANTDLGLIERAWETSKAYQNSTNVQRYDGALDMDRCQTLYNFINKEPEFALKDADAKSSDNLRKFIVIPMQVNRRGEEVGGNIEVNLILDSKGHDIGIYYVDENGQHFELSQKLKESNNKILKKFEGIVDERELKELSPDSLEDVVELVAKGKNIGLADEKEVLDRLDEKKPGSKQQVEDKQEEQERSEEGEEQEAEENAMSEIPEEQKSEIVEICKRTGRDVSDLKQTVTILHPETIIDEIDNDRTNIDENGGSVTALRFRNKEALGGTDEVVLVQDGEVLPEDKGNNETISNLMEQKQENGGVVHDLEDHREDGFKDAIKEILDKAEEKKEMLRSGNTPNLEEELDKVDENAKEEVKDLVASMKPQSIEMQKIAEETEKDIDEAAEDNSNEKPEEEQEQQEPSGDDYYFDELGRRRRMR